MESRLFYKINKLVLIIMTLFVITSTVQAKQENRLISIHRKNVPLRIIFNDIQKATHYRFLFKENIVDKNKRISIKVQKKPLSYILKLVLSNTGIKYKIIDNQIILYSKKKDAGEESELIQIQGYVFNMQRHPLEGVNIWITGSTNGTMTNSSGYYSLAVPKGQTIKFNYIGYYDKNIEINDETSLNITLIKNLHALNDVVVVGYSTQKRLNLTGAVSSVKMANLRDMSVSGINSALQGRMPGVTVLQSNGAPGAGTSIKIRGLGTIGNNDPLFIVDGMPADNMNDINPNDIESIDILKDASSAAIYGSRGANGVVIIETKKGSYGDKLRVSFNTYQGIATPSHQVAVLDANDRNMIHLEAYNNAVKYDGLVIDPASDPRKPYYTACEAYTNTNWQNQVFSNTAYQSNYDLSLSGGSVNAKYNIIGGHLNQEGILKNSRFNRSNLRINTEWQISNQLKIAENLMLMHSIQNAVESKGQDYGVLASALQYDPSVTVYDNRGNYSGSGPLSIDLRNPVSLINRSSDVRTRNRAFGNAYIEYTLGNFTFKSDFGYDWSDWSRKWFVPKYPEAGRTSDDNFLDEQKFTTTHWINSTTLKFEKSAKLNNIMILGGTSYENYDLLTNHQRGIGFSSEAPNQRYMSEANSIIYTQAGRQQWLLQSFFGRLDYSFANKYLVSTSFRMDGSSKFSPENRWGYFPSVSAGWVISEEAFFRHLKKYIPNLKIRGSWGILGNQNITSNYPTKPYIANTSDQDGYYVISGNGENAKSGRFQTNLPNPDLKWENSQQIDGGLDILFFGKLSIGVDYFDKKSSNVLISVPMPSLAGYTENYWENAAKISNKGYEINADFDTRINRVKLSIYGNVSSIKNNVESLGYGQSFYPSEYRNSNITRVAAGFPIGHFYGFKTGGIFKTQAEIDNYVNSKGQKLQPDAKVGDIKFLDINHDGCIDNNDRTDIGDGFPNFTYSFGTDISYKGFDLSMFWQGVAGNDIFDALKYEGMFVNGGYNNFAGILDRFDPEKNPNGNSPRVTVKDTNGNSRMSDFYVDKGDYLRLKILTVGYTFPRKLTSKFQVEKLRLFVTLQNLLTFTRYKGFDPEIGETYPDSGNGYEGLELGVDRGQVPQPKTFIVGLNLRF